MARPYAWTLSTLLVAALSLVSIAPAAAAPISLAGELGGANDFVLLDLNDGTMTINSSTSIIGNVGYSSGVTSDTNQKVDLFTGTAYVSSTVTSFSYTAATFAPSGGIIVGGAADTKLNQANIDAASAATFFGSLAATAPPLGNVTTNQTLTMPVGSDVAVYDATSWDFNSNTLTLNGDANDLFVFRVSGSFDWSQSQTILNGGLLSGQVLFYFPNASDIDINKDTTAFYGTILAPTSSVIYHNPATFVGAIIALNITVHSDFNIHYDTDLPSVPEPSTLVLLFFGAGILALRRFRGFGSPVRES